MNSPSDQIAVFRKSMSTDKAMTKAAAAAAPAERVNACVATVTARMLAAVRTRETARAALRRSNPTELANANVAGNNGG